MTDVPQDDSGLAEDGPVTDPGDDEPTEEEDGE